MVKKPRWRVWRNDVVCTLRYYQWRACWHGYRVCQKLANWFEERI